MMAALAILPHVQHDEHGIRVDTLDFTLLLTWWLFLYLFVVIPWQYVHPVETTYGRSFDLLYVERRTRAGRGLAAGLAAKPGRMADDLFSFFCGKSDLLRGFVDRE